VEQVMEEYFRMKTGKKLDEIGIKKQDTV